MRGMLFLTACGLAAAVCLCVSTAARESAASGMSPDHRAVALVGDVPITRGEVLDHMARLSARGEPSAAPWGALAFLIRERLECAAVGQYAVRILDMAWLESVDHAPRNLAPPVNAARDGKSSSQPVAFPCT